MAYGLKYQTQFNSQTDPNTVTKLYTLQFLFKDYTGGVTSIMGGETTVLQKCTNDDPTAPIKGQSLDIILVNKAGSLPITAFQSEGDADVQVKLLGAANEVLFIGFLVQDDFYETMVEYTHTITLSATDGLGLLKGVILSDAEVRRAFQASYRTNGVNTVVYFYVTDSAFYPQTSNPIEIDGVTYIIATAINETTVIGIATYNWTITLTTATPGIGPTVNTVYLTGEVNLMLRNSLLSMVAVCLSQTDLQLVTNIFHNLYEYRQDNTISTFAQTLIDSQLFISGNTYQDCYQALSTILTAFNCTLFQANGQWNIVNWHEARSYSNVIPGFVYDETWAAIGTTTLDNIFNIGALQLSRPIAGLTQGAMRGYKFTRKQFDYKQPKYLLRNYDLQELGALIRTTVISGSTYYDYVAPGWTTGEGPTLCDRHITVVKDSAGSETARYLVVSGPASNTTKAVSSDPIEFSEGDKLKFSCSFKTNISQPGAIIIVFAVMLTDGTSIKYVDEVPAGNGNWINTVGFSYTVTSGDNTNSWHSVEIESSQAPFSGLLYCYLPIATDSPYNSTRQTFYKDIRFEVTPYINDTSKITGQVHKQEQDVNKKLNKADEITIDDSPRNSIAGTLFLTSKTGLLQDRTQYWRYPFDANGWRLGELTTLQELLWRKITRSKLEGGFIGNYQGGIISLLTLAIADFNPSKIYTFGMLTIDYKRNQFSGTLWELYDSTDQALVNSYTFTYLYSTT